MILQALAHLGNNDFVDVITEVCILAGVSCPQFLRYGNPLTFVID